MIGAFGGRIRRAGDGPCARAGTARHSAGYVRKEPARRPALRAVRIGAQGRSRAGGNDRTEVAFRLRKSAVSAGLDRRAKMHYTDCINVSHNVRKGRNGCRLALLCKQQLNSLQTPYAKDAACRVPVFAYGFAAGHRLHHPVSAFESHIFPACTARGRKSCVLRT